MTDNEVSMSMGAIAGDPANSKLFMRELSKQHIVKLHIIGEVCGGATWMNYSSGLPSSTYFSRLKIRPNNSNHLLAALGNSGLYQSTYRGQNWVQILSRRVDDVLFSPGGDTAFAVGSGTGVRRSTNGGQNFSTFGDNLPSGTRTHFDLCLSNPAYMHAAIYSSSQVNIL
ncbi:MAG: WD40/YVTN/BNR-like repeat-containing protein [Ignavibacterium sp.]|uniref:WD40/YVTN/BNR-like repeat-containing protein n=1 Tax=Ignavibacterium sp. TaxID=2651167 RepID=UPI004049364E